MHVQYFPDLCSLLVDYIPFPDPRPLKTPIGKKGWDSSGKCYMIIESDRSPELEVTFSSRSQRNSRQLLFALIVLCCIYTALYSFIL